MAAETTTQVDIGWRITESREAERIRPDMTVETAERLRRFLQEHQVGLDQALMIDFYGPLRVALSQTDEETCEESFEHTKKYLPEVQELQEENERLRNMLAQETQYHLDKEGRLARDKAELESQVEALSALVDDKQETIDGLRETNDRHREIIRKHQESGAQLRREKRELLDEVDRLADAVQEERRNRKHWYHCWEGVRETLDEREDTLEKLREVFESQAVTEELNTQGKQPGAFMRLMMDSRGLGEYHPAGSDDLFGVTF